MQLKATTAVAVVALCLLGAATIKTTTDYAALSISRTTTHFVMKGTIGQSTVRPARATGVLQALTSKGWAEVPKARRRRRRHSRATRISTVRAFAAVGRLGAPLWGIGTATTFVEDYKVSCRRDIFDAEASAIWHVAMTPPTTRPGCQTTTRASAQVFASLENRNDPIVSPMARLTLALLLLVVGRSSAPAQQLRHIFFAEAPAILVQVDGAPVYLDIPGTSLERVTNTPALIVRDGAGIHYLKVLDGWMESYGFDDEWRVAGVSPFGENTGIERTVLAATADRLDRESVPFTGSLYEDPPTILIATDSAALVVTDGAPRYETVPGTALLRLANTKATVFHEATDEQFYVRVDKDWYRAWTTDGPWQLIATDQLPSDIATQIERR